MEWFVFWFALQLDWQPNTMFNFYDENTNMSYCTTDNAIIIGMEAEIRFFNELLFIGGSIDVSVFTNDVVSYTPYDIGSTIWAGIRYKMIEVGYIHYCIHPIRNHIYKNDHTPVYEGGYDSIYVRVEGKIGTGKGDE